jgi:hypothetical protein
MADRAVCGTTAQLQRAGQRDAEFANRNALPGGGGVSPPSAPEDTMCGGGTTAVPKPPCATDYLP